MAQIEEIVIFITENTRLVQKRESAFQMLYDKVERGLSYMNILNLLLLNITARQMF